MVRQGQGFRVCKCVRKARRCVPTYRGPAPLWTRGSATGRSPCDPCRRWQARTHGNGSERMGKRLVAMSFVAALSAWPAFGQEDGADDPTVERAPPVAGESASEAAPDEGAVATTPVTGDAESADAATEAPTGEDPQPEDAPEVDPIL